MNLQAIPTSVHGVLGYVASSTNLVAPKLLRLEDVPPATLAPRFVRVASAAYSLFTDYELGGP